MSDNIKSTKNKGLVEVFNRQHGQIGRVDGIGTLAKGRDDAKRVKNPEAWFYYHDRIENGGSENGHSFKEFVEYDPIGYKEWKEKNKDKLLVVSKWMGNPTNPTGVAHQTDMVKHHNTQRSGDGSIFENKFPTMKKSELKSIINEVISETMRDVVRVVARVNNKVFPYAGEELEKLANKHHIGMKFIGDAEFGTETLTSYRILFFGPSGEIDAFVHNLAEEKGIEFTDVPENPSRPQSRPPAQQVYENDIDNSVDSDGTWEDEVMKIANQFSGNENTNGL